MSARTRYESYYGFGMLDDLHNFFPDLLYNNGRFTTLQSVFAYMNAQMNDNFNLYARAREQTRRNVRPRFTATPSPTRRSYFDDMAHLHAQPVGQQRVAQPAAAAAQEPAPAAAPEPARPAAPQRQQRRTGSTLFPGVEIVTTDYIYQPTGGIMPVTGAGGTTAALASIASMLGIDLGPRNLMDTFAGVPGFSEPVPVRPTTAQINAATTEETVTEENDADDLVCAICQDDIAVGTLMRTIDYCDHSFHKNCIDTWFAQNVHCPVCRHDIRDNDEDEGGENAMENVD
jgi:hypothetical protein